VSISAMKYALDVLDNYVEDPRCETERVVAVNLLRQAIAEAEKTIYVDSSRFSKGPSDHKPGMVITEPVHARPVVHAVRCTYPQCQATNGCVGVCSKGQPDLARVGEVGVWGEEKNT
jgi:hypothetical protein